MKNLFFRILVILLIIIIIVVFIIVAINYIVILSSKDKIINQDEANNIENVDCILILGAGIWGDSPSPMLEDRLLQGIALYKNGVSSKIIMSGDNSSKDYNEVGIMEKYAIEKGVNPEDIILDNAGLSTYESVYRAKENFEAKSMVIVTQKYHLYRAIYIAEQIGIEVYGVASNPRMYAGQKTREIREIAARNKDFIKCIFKPQPKSSDEIIIIE